MAIVKTIVIDTNAYSAFKRGDRDAIEVAQTADTIILCPIVLGELLAGFELGRKTAQNRKELEEFLADPRVVFLTINAQTSETYAKIYLQLRENGTPIPTNDMWIAAFAKQLEVGVFSYDDHFAKVQDLILIRKASDFIEP